VADARGSRAGSTANGSFSHDGRIDAVEQQHSMTRMRRNEMETIGHGIVASGNLHDRPAGGGGDAAMRIQQRLMVVSC